MRELYELYEKQIKDLEIDQREQFCPKCSELMTLERVADELYWKCTDCYHIEHS